ncbi:type I-F CRISPR-associated protein Csy2 [Salinisphaera japonica]|uniref:CRISPR-associated protein Csy2 n=1 Tax=Salinisphaera japonica YTM-1 TaxID=1209778 RepID=A0A423PE21_9GAMM|nr:type I-F CRISPR-associated protein Csy2 [Salinisphaera japonica]ROO23820.1 CRISPR-associated protein Csy2 [Salinisphaera japonica YTM-1]
MSDAPNFTHLLVLPRLNVQNANAISSPLTHGFPSITAFIGLMWALERKTRAAGLDVAFQGIGVVCHRHQEQTTEGGYTKAFHLTRNPAAKDGSTAAIVEEGRIHIEVSLILAVTSDRWQRDAKAQQDDTETIQQFIAAMRIAGGSVMPPDSPWLPRYQPQVVDLTGNEADRLDAFRKLRLRLVPGFTLVSRDDLITQRHDALAAEDANATRLDAWLSLSRINWRYNDDEHKWQHDRRGLGWVVPIPVGYGALGDVHPGGDVVNARDPDTPFRFAESLYSMGQWISPHRLEQAEQLIWYAQTRPDDGLYRCCNDYRPIDDPFEALYDFD